MITVTLAKIDGVAITADSRGLDRDMLLEPPRPLVIGDDSSACLVTVGLQRNGLVVAERWQLTGTFTAIVAALTTDAAESGAEVTTNKSTDFAAANRNDTKYPSTEAVYENFQPIWYAATTGTDTYAATMSPVPTAYFTGMKVQLLFGNTNTGAATINLNTLGAKDLRKGVGGVTALAASDLVDTKIYTATYNGTLFQLDL